MVRRILIGAALLNLGFETRDGRPDSLAKLARFILDAAILVQDQSFVNRDLLQEVGQSMSASRLIFASMPVTVSVTTCPV